MGPVERAERPVPARDSAGHEATPAPAAARRVFLRWREAPGLLLGILRADPVAHRRVLGARKGGRLGVLLALAALLLAAPGLAQAAGLAALHVALTLVSGLASGAGLRVRQRLRLSLWAAAPPLLLAAVPRLAGTASAVPALLALVAAQMILVRGQDVAGQSWSDGDG